MSLGTSDTVFGLMREPRVDVTGTGHVFGAPTGDYMGLTCFQNGSLARERVRNELGMDWGAFSRALDTTPPRRPHRASVVRARDHTCRANRRRCVATGSCNADPTSKCAPSWTRR